MKIWFKIWKENHIRCDLTVEDETEDTRTHKVVNALDRACQELDLMHPQWLDPVIRDFKMHAKARFTQDAFAEEIDFDCLEIEVLEED